MQTACCGRSTATASWGAGNFQDIFNQWFSRNEGSPQKTPQKGADLEYGLNIDFWQAIRGTQVRLSVTRQETCTECKGTGARAGANTVCPECNGSGNVTQVAGAMRFSLTCPRCEGSGRLGNRCPTCHGDGRVSKTETVDVRIPPGAQQGSRLRVAHKAMRVRSARRPAIFTSPSGLSRIRSSAATVTTSK